MGFLEVQMPQLRQKEFWKDLKAGFNPGSRMERELLAMRKQGRPLQTGCFLIIPERILKDDDQNLVRNICLRSQRLIDLAAQLYPIVNDKKTTSAQKFDLISKGISDVKSLGDTWVKMLMVCIDIRMPHLKLLHDRCEVGVGAADPMRKLLEDEGLVKPKVQKEKLDTGDKVCFGDNVSVQASLRSGIVSVKRDGVQMVQITRGMAGTLDRAQAIGELLAKTAVKKNLTVKQQDVLKAQKDKLMADKTLKVPALGYDARYEKVQAKLAAEGPVVKDPDECTPSEALAKLLGRINHASEPSAKHFWQFLNIVEAHARKHFKHLSLVVEQMKTKPKSLSAVTLQVQLCEYRQFLKYMEKPGKRSWEDLDAMAE